MRSETPSPAAEGVGTEENGGAENATRVGRPDGYPRRVRSRHKTLPRFERDGERIVKVSWSKRAKAEYEHRAPRDVVFSLLDAIRIIGKKFRVHAQTLA